jgi:hypothetical protein
MCSCQCLSRRHAAADAYALVDVCQRGMQLLTGNTPHKHTQLRMGLP